MTAQRCSHPAAAAAAAAAAAVDGCQCCFGLRQQKCTDVLLLNRCAFDSYSGFKMLTRLIQPSSAQCFQAAVVVVAPALRRLQARCSEVLLCFSCIVHRPGGSKVERTHKGVSNSIAKRRKLRQQRLCIALRRKCTTGSSTRCFKHIVLLLVMQQSSMIVTDMIASVP
jgi:hypothetical protein